MLAATHKAAFVRAKVGDPRRSDEEALDFPTQFVSRIIEQQPSEEVSVHQLLTDSYVRQGIDEDEIRDDHTIAELSALGTFRSQSRVIAEETGLPFERLKRVPVRGQ